MNAFSGEPISVVAKVRPRQILCLLEILCCSSIRQRSFVSAQFDERARHFPETLQFLVDLGWIKSDGENLELLSEYTTAIIAAHVSQRPQILAEFMFDNLGAYESLFIDYLSQFSLQNGVLVHHPEGEARLRESPVRDFLLDLGAVGHELDDDFYALAEPFAHLHLWARNRKGPTEHQMREQTERRAEFGRQAELAVLEWERQRVGPPFANRVRHIAVQSPAACFDIQSVTDTGTTAALRFIEVKAVSTADYRFFWTAGEREAAQVLGARYFLYLLPVRGAGKFELEQLQVISNPYIAVLQNPLEWSKEDNVVECRKRNANNS